MGATTLPPGANGNIDAETAVTAFGSGGGFSNIYPIPSYQASALSQFYAVNNPPYPYYSAADGGTFGTNGGVYNRSGRGIPDFASVGQNILVYLGGVLSLIGGTSVRLIHAPNTTMSPSNTCLRPQHRGLEHSSIVSMRRESM